LEELIAVTPSTITVITPVLAPDGTVVVILVAVLAVTVAVASLNFTVLFAGVVLKFVPVITTDVPILPEPGVKEIIDGTSTVKFVELVAVCPLTVTVIAPELAPKGTDVVILVVVLAVAVAMEPLNFTILFAGVALKFVPVITTDVPTLPLSGVKEVMVGTGTPKLVELVAVFPFTVTVIGPVVIPAGTDVVILVVVLAVTMAVVPLNFTILFADSVLKFVPVIVTDVPSLPV
jgi:hypothetical protein